MRVLNPFAALALLLAIGCPQFARQSNSDFSDKSATLELRETADSLLKELEPGATHYLLLSNGQTIGLLTHTGEELTELYIYDTKGKRAVQLSRKDDSFTDLLSYSILNEAGEPVTTFYDNHKQGVPQMLRTGAAGGRIYDRVEVKWKPRESPGRGKRASLERGESVF